MTLSVVFEIALGLALVYYVLGLIVSGITTEITKYTELRARVLEGELKELLADDETYDKIKGHPWIKTLIPKRVNILGGEIRRKIGVPDRIPASTLALTLFDILAPGEKGSDAVNKIRDGIGILPEGSAKTSLLGLLNSGVSEIAEARKQVESWIDDAMENVGFLYKQHARRIVIITALVVTLVTGADTVEIARNLWVQPSLRAGVVARVDEIVQEEEQAPAVDDLLDELDALQIPIFWSTLPRDFAGWLRKIVGLLITWIATCQGSSFWYDVLRKARSDRPAPAAVSTARG